MQFFNISYIIVYTTQVNSTFRARWLANLDTTHLRAADKKQNGFRRYIVTNKVALWAASYSACVSVSVKVVDIYLAAAARQISTTIHLHFGE